MHWEQGRWGWLHPQQSVKAVGDQGMGWHTTRRDMLMQNASWPCLGYSFEGHKLGLRPLVPNFFNTGKSINADQAWSYCCDAWAQRPSP